MSKAKRIAKADKIFEKAYRDSVLACMEETAKARDTYNKTIRQIKGDK